MLKVLRWLRADLWSPIGAGVVLGLVAVLSMWVAEHPVGASGAFQSLAAYVGLELTSQEVIPEPEPVQSAVAEASDDEAAFWGDESIETADASFWGEDSGAAASETDDAGFWGEEANTTTTATSASDDAAFWGDDGAESSAAAPAASEDEPAAPQKVTVAKEGWEKQYTFFAFTSPKGISWLVWVVIGVFLGSLTSSVLSGGFKISLMPHSEQWVAVFGPQVWKRWALVFIGSVVIAIAAGIAGGCTSGLAIAKGIQLHPAAFLFIIGMFITGPAVAALVYGRRF